MPLPRQPGRSDHSGRQFRNPFGQGINEELGSHGELATEGMHREDRHCWKSEIRKEFDQSSHGKILRDRDMKQVCDSCAAYDGFPDRPAVVGHKASRGWKLCPIGENIGPGSARRDIAHEDVPTEILKIGGNAVS